MSADQLLLSHLPMVKAMARHYASCSAETLDDLQQAGLLGLATAAQRYRSSAERPFACFARPHVRGAMLHHLRDHAWLVRLPRRQAERLQRSRSENNDAAAAEQSVEGQALQQWRQLNRPVSLEWLQAEAEDFGLKDWVALESAEEANAADAYTPRNLDPRWQDSSLEQMLNLVEKRQRVVLTKVILLGWSYRRTATALGVSAPTVQRLLHRGLETLRQHLSSHPIRPDAEVQRHGSSAPQVHRSLP